MGCTDSLGARDPSHDPSPQHTETCAPAYSRAAHDDTDICPAHLSLANGRVQGDDHQRVGRVVLGQDEDALDGGVAHLEVLGLRGPGGGEGGFGREVKGVLSEFIRGLKEGPAPWVATCYFLVAGGPPCAALAIGVHVVALTPWRRTPAVRTPLSARTFGSVHLPYATPSPPRPPWAMRPRASTAPTAPTPLPTPASQVSLATVSTVPKPGCTANPKVPPPHPHRATRCSNPTPVSPFCLTQQSDEPPSHAASPASRASWHSTPPAARQCPVRSTRHTSPPFPPRPSRPPSPPTCPPICR